MRSIRKIVSTPVKWASREILHRTLLRFPGGEADDPVACAFCPEMCRFACPTAVTSANDAVTTAAKMGLLHARREWPDQTAALGEPWPIYDCTGCGRCTEYCVYEVNAGEHLFAARAQAPWARARQRGAELFDAEDPWGDLSAELGMSDDASRRTAAFISRQGTGVAEVPEPKAVFHLGMAGASVALSWQSLLLLGAKPADPAWNRVRARLAGRRWVVQESVWLSRRLGRFEQVKRFVESARVHGIEVKLSSAVRADVEDCGGEGAYPRIFPETAAKMAREWWERSSRRTGAEGVLAMSPRAGAFLRSVLPPSIEILDMALLAREFESRGGGK